MGLLNDFKIGEQFQGSLLVKNTDKRKTKNDKDYMSVTLGDKSGVITAMLWELNENVEGTFKSGTVVDVTGVISEYQGKRQLKIHSANLTDDLSNIDKLIESAPFDGIEMYKNIIKIISMLKNEVLKDMTITMLERYREPFTEYPAAKMIHHSYRSGLIYHTLSMIRIGTRLCKLYPEVNPDLLLSGIALHDLMKIKEYEVNNLDGVGYIGGADFSFDGQMKGHISMINEEIYALAKELGYENREEVALLQNVLLAHHHGKQALLGSPVAGKTIEAILINQIDLIDSSIDTYRIASKNVNDGEFTEKIFSLGNNSLYKHNLPKG